MLQRLHRMGSRLKCFQLLADAGDVQTTCALRTLLGQEHGLLSEGRKVSNADPSCQVVLEVVTAKPAH